MDSREIIDGIVGEHKYIFDIFGDAVNTAFRLEAVSAPMSCTISEKTAQIIEVKYPLYKRPARNIKGKGVLTNYYLLYKKGVMPLAENSVSLLYETLCKNYEEKTIRNAQIFLNTLIVHF